MANDPKKSETSSERYERLLKGEIDADQYVKSLQREARGRARSARTGRYAVKDAGSRVGKRAEAS